MNKTELIKAIASQANLSKTEAKRFLDTFISATTNGLKRSHNVSLTGFGVFSVYKRAARKGRNPQTGKTIQISSKRIVRFKAGKEFHKKCN